MATNNAWNSNVPVEVTKGGTGTSTVPTNGQILIGNGSSYTVNSLTAGHDLSVVNAAGSVTVALNNAITLGDITPISADSGAVTCTTGDIIVSAGDITLPDTNAALNQGVIKFGGSRFVHNFGNSNVFIGLNAGNGSLTTVSASQNVGIGMQALLSLTTGSNNTAIGSNGGALLTTGSRNFALGTGNLVAATTASSNIAIGVTSEASITTGGFNIAIGDTTLASLTTGSSNTIVGSESASGYTTSESDNIILGRQVSGTAGESNVLRIGAATGTGTSKVNKAVICGIRGITTGNADAVAVLVDSANQLGTVSSSIRYKENVHDMEDNSELIMDLRPVVFNYKQHPNVPAWGLIAEEVADVFPQLAVYDKEGQPEAVKYHDLPVLLLNEIQKLTRRVEELEGKIVHCSCK